MNIQTYKEARLIFERDYVIKMLNYCEGNISQAARLAKKDRKDFYLLIKRTGVNPNRYRDRYNTR